MPMPNMKNVGQRIIKLLDGKAFFLVKAPVTFTSKSTHLLTITNLNAKEDCVSKES
jgi:hypothetical protein